MNQEEVNSLLQKERDDESILDWQVVCPWCGHIQSDPWEFFLDEPDDAEIEVDCQKCEKPMVVSRIVTVDYETRKGEVLAEREVENR